MSERTDAMKWKWGKAEPKRAGGRESAASRVCKAEQEPHERFHYRTNRSREGPATDGRVWPRV